MSLLVWMFGGFVILSYC